MTFLYPGLAPVCPLQRTVERYGRPLEFSP